ncbi:ester cyclase [Parasphingorhabdus sp.]|uniref:ester cyclase n=1 Tax=Parasphingorhabdus sp. TaxID=2709688 RepID=UPI003A8FCAF7
MGGEISARKQILTDFLQDVWTDGQVEKVDHYLADNYSIHNDPGDPWDGQTLSIAGFKDRLIQSRAMAPDQIFDVEKMVEEGNDIAVAWSWSGTHLGDIPGIPATGRNITMTGLTIYSFEGDRLSGHWQIADRLSVFQQLTQGPG